MEHALFELPGSIDSAAAVKSLAQNIVPVGRGVVIGLVAEPGKTAAKYENHESLVWRDAGVVLGYMSVVAEALQLSFCPLGVLGHIQLTASLTKPHSLQGAGLAILGAE